jgi:type IV pilus assembly protein PilW
MVNMTDKNGFSLVELLVALAMASVIMTAMFLVYKAQVMGKTAQEVTLELQQSGRAGLELITRDIRMAGCDPLRVSGAGFVTANAGDMRITMDIAGFGNTDRESDGVIEDSGEDVRYAINTSGHLGRETFTFGTMSGNLQPLVRNVDALDFQYLDSDGNDLGDPVDLTAIRSVEVSFVVRSGTDSGAQRGMLAEQTDTRRYRNLQGTQILPAQNDDARRLQFSTTIHCRNMGR